MYSPFVACVKKNIFGDNQKPIIFEDMIIIALFLELTNQISLKKPNFHPKKSTLDRTLTTPINYLKDYERRATISN